MFALLVYESRPNERQAKKIKKMYSPKMKSMLRWEHKALECQKNTRQYEL